MKKILVVLVALFVVSVSLAFVGCNSVGLYKVTIVDETDRFFDKPEKKYFSAGTTITLRCNPIMDADLVMYVNGEREGIQTSVWYEGEGFVWEYYYTVQEKDVTITFDIDGGM